MSAVPTSPVSVKYLSATVDGALARTKARGNE